MLGLVLTIFFASSFTTALQRVYFHAWRRPRHSGAVVYWRGLVCLVAVLVAMALLGGLGDDLDGGLQVGLFAIAALAATSGLWWFVAWFLLLGEVRARVLAPTGVITGVATAAYAASATIWMPEVVTSNEEQFGVFGVALALVTWFSGAAICILVGPAPEWSSPRTPDGSARSCAAPTRRPSPRVPAHRCRHPPTS